VALYEPNRTPHRRDPAVRCCSNRTTSGPFSAPDPAHPDRFRTHSLVRYRGSSKGTRATLASSVMMAKGVPMRTKSPNR
jgi:hypothetical protein